MKKKVLRKFKVTQDLTGTPLDFTTETADGGPLTHNFKLVSVHIHLSAAVSPTIAVNRVSADGVNYNTPFDTTTLAGNDDYILEKAEGEGICIAGDQIGITITAVVATCYVTLIVEDI